MGKAQPGQAARHPGGRRPVADRLPHHRAAAVHGQGQVDAGPGGRDRRARRRPRTRSAWTCRWSGATRDGRAARGAGRRPGRGAAGSSRSSASPGSASPGWSRSCWTGVDDVLVACAPRARSTSRRRRTSRSAGCCATCSASRPDAGADEVAAGWSTGSSVNAPHLVPWLPLLGVPLDLELRADPGDRGARRAVPQGPARGRRQRVPAWVLPTSTVLVIEDAHLMDDASADLLRRLAAELDGRPWLVAGHPPRPAGRLRAGARSAGLSRCGPRRWTPEAALALVQAALDDHPLPPQALDDPRRPRRRQPDVPRGAGAGGGPVGLGGRPARVGRRRWSPARSTGSTRPTAPCCATPRCSGMVVDEAALDALLDEHDGTRRRPARSPQRPAGRLPGARASRAAAVPARAHARRRLRGPALQPAAGCSTTRSGQAIERPPHARRRSASCCRCTSSTPGGTTRPGTTRCSPASGRWPSTPTARRSTSSSAPSQSARRDAGDRRRPRSAGARAARRRRGSWSACRRRPPRPTRWPAGTCAATRSRLAGIIEKEARIDQRLAQLSQALRRISRGLHELEGMTGPEARSGALAAGPPLRLTAGSARAGSTRRCAGPSSLPARPRSRSTRTPWPRPTRCSTTIYAGSGRDGAAALRPAGPAGLRRAGRPAPAGARA